MNTLKSKITITKSDKSRLQKFFTEKQNTFEFKENIKTIVEKLNAKPIDSKKVPPNVVTMNSKVAIKNVALNKTITLQLVYPDSVNVGESKISIFSPIGATLLGHSQGDEIAIAGGNGRSKFVIEKIIYQPEAAGDYHL